ncbi:MAG: segregation and condensation protein A [Candidatus Aminicenantia bacterium]
MKTAGYQVKLEIFEGPLELLLFLIRKNKIDIYDIPMAKITHEYLDYLNRKDKINLDREGDFLLVAATLIYIKSQMLLPREKEIEFEEDPRQSLVDQLLEYQKIKNISFILSQKESEQLVQWKRFHSNLNLKEEIILKEASVFDLAEAFYKILKRKEREEIQTIEGRKFSVEEKMEEILFFLRKNKNLDFLDYFNSQTSLQEAIISFFGLLELIKSRNVVAIQENLFQTIKVWLRRHYLRKELRGEN